MAPNNAAGFGLVNVAAAIDDGVILQDAATALDTGEEEQATVTVNAQSTRLKVTLVWTDPKGAALQNDLDLIVRASNGEERHGNVAPPSLNFDRANNVEQVIWTRPPLGNVEIIVQANRIALLPQSYALVIALT